MRIDPKVTVSPITSDTKSATQAKTPESPATASGPAGASVVSLSSAAVAVPSHAASQSITARLEKIRALLDAGEYPMDLDALASRIVDDEIVRAGRPDDGKHSS